jgi:integrase
MAIRKRVWTAKDGTEKHAWLVDYRDQSGKRRAKQFDRKKDAEAWRVSVAWQVSQGTHTADSQSITIAQAGELWIETVTLKGREATTIAAYDQHVRLHINPLCGAVKLSRLTKPNVIAYRNQWMKDLSAPMASRVLKSLRMMIKDAQERGLVAQNVALGVTVDSGARSRPQIVIPPKKALAAILGQSGGDRAPALHCLAIFAGLRASELRGLSWQAIHLAAGTVTVSQRADAKNKLGPPKSQAGRRTIPLPEMALKALRKWKLACPPSPAGLVFPSPAGAVISHPAMLQGISAPVQAACGLVKDESAKPLYGLHAFRHACASLWIEQNVSPKRIQTWMGHSSIQVTFDTYGHLFSQAEKDAGIADAVEAAIFSDAT